MMPNFGMIGGRLHAVLARPMLDKQLLNSLFHSGGNLHRCLIKRPTPILQFQNEQRIFMLIEPLA